uniref:C-type lectin domain-containing protein n=1 Tax=Panagrolaimus davidi TaxID=227884 RepID=A0A914P7F8_9BILA
MLSFFIFLSFFHFSLAACPKNSKPWQSKCYFFENTKAQFVTAEIFCNSLGGNLVSVHDGFTNTFLAEESNFTKTVDFWIGITNLINPGNWSWTDGSPYDFSNWRDTTNIYNPKAREGHSCGAIASSTGLWNADDCFLLKPCVCEVNESSCCLQHSTTSIPTAASTSPHVPCASDWVFYASSASCYRRTEGNYNFTDGEKYCVKQGGHLASIHNKDEFDFTQGIMGQTYFRIGLHSVDNKKTWEWTDGSPLDYTPWDYDYGNPDNGSFCAMAGFGIFENNNNCEGVWSVEDFDIVAVDVKVEATLDVAYVVAVFSFFANDVECLFEN